MNKNNTDKMVSAFGDMAKKVLDSAVHAAIFSFVSKKVTNFMNKKEEEEKNTKIRIEESSNSNLSKLNNDRS